jgi:hypothetical protein
VLYRSEQRHRSEQHLQQITRTENRGIRGAAHREEPSMVEEDGGGQPNIAGEDFRLRMMRMLGEEETRVVAMAHGQRHTRPRR